MNGTEVVARWTSPRRTRPQPCDECAESTAGPMCAGCGQLVGGLVGMLAILVDTPAGRQLVISQRVGSGWVPLRAMPASVETVAMVRRQQADAFQVCTGSPSW